MLIDELRSEHEQISLMLLQAKSEGVGTQEGRDLMMSAKKLLLGHLNKEDRYLYPVLRAAAEKDEGLKNTLAAYAQDMENISSDVMLFFSMYESGSNTMENFQTDCNNIIKELSKRITKEEAVLYKQYQNLANS